MIGVTMAAAGTAAMLVGVGQYFVQVAGGDLRPPPASAQAAVVSGAATCLGAAATGVWTGQPAAVAAGVGGLAFASLALGVYTNRRIPRGSLAVSVGDRILPFEATTPDGEPFSSEAFAGRRVLLKFFRGEWCPFCQAELRGFEAMREPLAARGVSIVALSKDAPEDAARHRARDHLGFQLLCDPRMTVIRQYGVEHHRSLQVRGRARVSVLGASLGFVPSVAAMAIPTTLLIDETGVVRWIDQTDDYMVRSSVERVLGAVDAAFGEGGPVPSLVRTAPVPTDGCPAC